MSDTNLDDILDSSIDDLADMPEFAIYPAGVHRVLLKLESKEVNKHPAIEAKMVAIETVELADASDTPLADGAEGSSLYMLDNEFGQGKFKVLAKELAAALGVSKISEVIEATAGGIEVVVVTKVRHNKDKTQSYTEITKVSLA